ncbi:MAG TPA: hypothetical protein ENN23_06145 [Deltaproteobacteria bacterium]|nr:hypothetical protein [Deltaproteobacteria bacterium]
MDALIILNTCIRNMRLYPATSSKVVSDVERLHNALLDILKDNDSLSFEKSEEGVLLEGKILDESEGGKWQVNAFSKILLDFDIKNISFDKQLEKDELTALLEALAKSPADLKKHGGLQKILQQKNISTISLNKEKPEKEAETSKEQQLLSPDNITDNKIIQSSIRVKSKEDEIAEEIRKISTHSDYLIRAFNERLTEMTEKREETPHAKQLSESIYGMINLIDKVSKGFENKDKSKISQEIGKSILALKSDIAGHIKEKNLSSFFDGSLAEHLVAQQETGVEENPSQKETAKKDAPAPAFPLSVPVTQQTDKEITKDKPLRKQASQQPEAVTFA